MNTELFSDKRLLIFPGSFAMCSIVEHAKKLGIYTIITDFYENWDDAPAKKLADEAYNFSYGDVDFMFEFCKEHRVDGIFTAFSENSCLAAARLSEKSGLPFYATPEQIEITRDKSRFKRVCEAHGLKTVREYQIDGNNPECIPSDIEYPVVVKPVDNGGSKGITVANDEESLRKSIEYALSYSASKQIIVERYMTGQECNVTYTLQNGNAVLSLVSDSQLSTTEEGHLNLPYAWMFPSKHYQKILEQDDSKIKQMFKTLGMKDGMCFLTCFAQPDGFYYFECGYRVGGGMTFMLQEHNYKKSFLDLMLCHALTGDSSILYDLSYDDFSKFKPCGNLIILLRSGIITKYIGFDKLKDIPGVIGVSSTKPLGTKISDSGDYGQNLCRIIICAESGEHYADIVDKIYDTIDVLDENGDSMLLGRFDSNIPRHYWENQK